MNRSLIFLFILFILIGSTPGLNAEGIGIKAGINITDLTNLENEYFEMGTKSGMAVGVFYCFDITDEFSIQPEFLYMMKGVRDSGITDGNEWAINFNIDYLEFPILLKYRFPYYGRFEPNLFAGPYLAMKLSAKTKATVNRQSVSEDVEDIHSVDYGIIFGGGLDFELWSGHLVLDARYAFGLRDVSTEGMEKKTLHRVFSMMLGYRF